MPPGSDSTETTVFAPGPRYARVTPRGPVKNMLRAAISRPAVRRPLRAATSSRKLPGPLRDILIAKIAKRVHFAPDASFSHESPNGHTLRFLNQGVGTDLYWLGDYEPGSLGVFVVLCREARIVFDVGANAGIYALVAAAENPDLRVLACEPSPRAIEICRRNLELNRPLAARVELLAVALAAHDGRAPFYLSGGTSSLNSEFRPGAADAMVDVARGDAIARQHDLARVDLIKLDTESTEPDVLRGFSATLSRDRPDLLCEVLHGRTEGDLDSIVESLGYARYWITAEGLHPRDRVVGDPTYRFPNYLFTVRPPSQLAALGITILDGAPAGSSPTRVDR
jgi:FkbM family methyltransferase